MARRVSSRPSPAGLFALEALARVAPADTLPALRDALAEVGGDLDAASAEPAYRAVSAWRAVDVWESERVLFVDFDGPRAHTLLASILDTGGTMIDRLGLLEFGAAPRWDDEREPGEIPMPLAAHPVEEALVELASALRDTDMIWPRHDDRHYVDLRALAWARCRGHEPAWPEWEPMPQDVRTDLIDAFVAEASVPDDDVTRSLADLFLDYGDGYIRAGALAWSPMAVHVFLADWLPRKAALDAEQRHALPEVLREWLPFVLARRGVEPPWIEPVVAQVDVALPEFEEAFDDESAWGPAKSMVAELTRRGVDLTDESTVRDAIRGVNAEQLARRMLEE